MSLENGLDGVEQEMSDNGIPVERIRPKLTAVDRNIDHAEIDRALDVLSALGYDIWLSGHLLVRSKNTLTWVKK